MLVGLQILILKAVGFQIRPSGCYHYIEKKYSRPIRVSFAHITRSVADNNLFSTISESLFLLSCHLCTINFHKTHTYLYDGHQSAMQQRVMSCMPPAFSLTNLHCFAQQKALSSQTAAVFFQTAAVFFQTAAVFSQTAVVFFQTAAVFVTHSTVYVQIKKCR